MFNVQISFELFNFPTSRDIFLEQILWKIFFGSQKFHDNVVDSYSLCSCPQCSRSLFTAASSAFNSEHQRVAPDKHF